MKTTVDNPRVLYEKREQVAYITLDRPHVHNAMDLRMHKELAVIWDDFEADDNIRVGVITGAGNRVRILVKMNTDSCLKVNTGSHSK